MKSVLTHSLVRAFHRSTETFRPDRRKFIQKGLLATLAMTLPATGCVPRAKNPSIVIVGAGIAGLTAAYELQKLGIDSRIYEAMGRTGGRVLTVEDAVVEGAHVDFGAEYIDGTHQDLIDLASELKVELVDLHRDSLIPKCYYFGGRKYSEDDLVLALKPYAGRIARDVASLPAELHYSKADQFRALDKMSIAQYLSALGVSGWLLSFFHSAMKSEYAMETSQQSAINLLSIFSVPIGEGSHYHVFGSEHEVFKFKGGTQRLVDKLNAQVLPRVKTGWQLDKLDKEGEGYALTFLAEGKKELVAADYVILTIPFTVLRSMPKNFSFPERKQRCIATLGFGEAAKVAMGFNRRVWRDQGYQGYAFTDVNETAIWDSSLGVNLAQGSLTFVTGGKESVDIQDLDYPEIEARWLTGAEQLYPGLGVQYNKRIAKFCWRTHPYSKGSYTSYAPGQWSDFAGVEQESFENIHFAGEHCSVKHQGFMNGAVESGKRAAREVAGGYFSRMEREKDS